ncbi:hypothetical protein THL1_472 [Pseudomonas sp. TCU-HL1]|nr:hypothetical protein THL1_472 [Pseudomonas sp. TCU-HL1]
MRFAHVMTGPVVRTVTNTVRSADIVARTIIRAVSYAMRSTGLMIGAMVVATPTVSAARTTVTPAAAAITTVA